ncbi:MAG: Ig-like domain-containing protein [Opitutaceae bacterium]
MKLPSRKLKKLKPLGIACLASMAIGTAQAADITWDPPVAITAATDVSTTGVLVEAVNPTKTSTLSPVINGVTFDASTEGVVMGSGAESANYFTPDTGNPDYNSLLQSFSWGSDELYPGVGVGSGNLLPGQQYLIQLWYSDYRTNDHGSNEVTYGDGNGNLSAPLNDQRITGYFTADSGYQTITASRYNPITDTTGTGYCNAYQIRQLSSFPVPTLSTSSNSVSGNFSVNIDFSEAVTGLEESDFSVVNGAVQTSSLNGSGANWSVIIDPIATGDVSVTLPASSVIDGESESNLESNNLVTTYVAPGSAQPIATLSTPLVEADQPYSVYINFTEPVTGLELNDFLITNGMLSKLSGSGASYSILVTPFSSGDVTLNLAEDSVTDLNDNLQNPPSNVLVRAYSGPQSTLLYRDYFDNDTLAVNTSGIGGGAVNRTIQSHAWTDDGDANFITNGTTDTQRALLYSENAFQSDTGFRLTVAYTTGSIEDLGSHNLSFGLISSDTDLASYNGFNPYQADTSVYSIGANVTADGGTATRGLNFTDGSTTTTLDESGTRVQFATGESTEVTIEIGVGGYWCYRINGIYEASGVLLEGFDLTKDYHVVVYGQDDDGGGKAIQSISLKRAYALGERAAHLRGTWASVDHDDFDSVSDFKTLDTLYARFNEGSVVSGNHSVPHKLLERLALEGWDGTATPITSVVPTWGDLSLDEPETDVEHDQMLAIKALGFKVKVYSNSEQFVGSNTTEIDAFVVRWKEWCDNDPEAQAFINSQPYHTNVWNSSTQLYDTPGPANRKYCFCYAEFVLKDFALRYGHLIDSWIWDSAADLVANGDVNNGVLEDQRIFQAFANAVHAGNPEIPLAFNLGRSNGNYPSYPFQQPTHFDDFTFGHAFGGNNNHAAKPPDGNQFNLNYQHITRMTATDGFVHVGGNQDFDELVVGNFHSKLGPISWRYSNPPAWEQVDFNQWNLEAMQAGGSMTWSGATTRSNTSSIYSEAYAILAGLDAHLAEFESPGTPNWTRAYTLLSDAATGVPYLHTLVDGADFWDPEGDAVTLILGAGAPSWLTLAEDPSNPGSWLLEGVPTETTETEYEFGLLAADATSGATERIVHLTVEGIPVNIALAGLATQSSTDFDGVPSRAIDGDTNGSYGQDSVTHTTDEAQPWWRVDLGTAYAIDEIVIWNRSGSTSIRLIDFDVFILDGGDSIVWSSYQANSPDPSVSLLPAGTTGQHVMVQLRGTEALSLAEVQIFGNLASDQALWRFDNFGIYDNTGIAADTYDTDFDGNLNLIEYATGTDPNTPGPSPFTIQSDGGSGFEVVFDRILNPALNYFVEGTSILPATSWDPIWSGTGTSAGTVTVPDTLWPSGNNEYFLRLRISY